MTPEANKAIALTTGRGFNSLLGGLPGVDEVRPIIESPARRQGRYIQGSRRPRGHRNRGTLRSGSPAAGEIRIEVKAAAVNPTEHPSPRSSALAGQTSLVPKACLPITPSFVLLPNCPSSEHNLMGCLHSQCADLAV